MENAAISNKARTVLWAVIFSLGVAALAFAAIRSAPQSRQTKDLALHDAVLAQAVGTRADLGGNRSASLVEYLGFAEWEAASHLHAEDIGGWNIYPRADGKWLVTFEVRTSSGSLRYDWEFEPSAKKMKPANAAAAAIKLAPTAD